MSAIFTYSSERSTFTSLLLAGIAKIGLDGTLYDQVLDWIFALGLAPSRFSKLSGYDLYFAMARGTEGAVALDMSKFFDTNYHYMVKLLHTFQQNTQSLPRVCCICCDPHTVPLQLLFCHLQVPEFDQSTQPRPDFQSYLSKVRQLFLRCTYNTICITCCIWQWLCCCFHPTLGTVSSNGRALTFCEKAKGSIPLLPS